MFNNRAWRDYVENILVAVFLALFVRTFILTGYRVPTSSMAPTLLPGDLIFSYRLPYGFKLPLSQKKLSIQNPRRGEVVVFSFPEQPRVSYVKRIIGLPGDRIEIKGGHLSLNGKALVYSSHEENGVFEKSDLFHVVREIAPEGERLLTLSNRGSQRTFDPLVVPPNEIFLLGDNRDAIDDLHYWGTVPMDRIEGRVSIIWLSLDWSERWADGRLPRIRQDRVFSSVR